MKAPLFYRGMRIFVAMELLAPSPRASLGFGVPTPMPTESLGSVSLNHERGGELEDWQRQKGERQIRNPRKDDSGLR